MATREHPMSTSRSSVAASRTPPPVSTDTPSTPQMPAIARAFLSHASSSSPSAADRSTTWIQLAPRAQKSRATATGSLE